MRIQKLICNAACIIAGALATTAAHAGGQVQWQVGIETPVIRLPGHVVLPLPPIPVPRVVVTRPIHDPRHDRRDYRAPTRWDVDGDGIPNRHDRAYTPRWDRDGDGIPNRHDAHPDDARNGRDWGAPRGWRGDAWRHGQRDERPRR